MNGQKLILSNDQFKEYKYALSKAKDVGRYNKNLDIKEFLETYEKKFEEDRNSFRYINKPVIDEEPFNVSKAKCQPLRRLKRCWKLENRKSVWTYNWFIIFVKFNCTIIR